MTKNTWTVLIYANGNNNLEKKIYTQFKSLRNAVLPENINVIIQISSQQSVCRYQVTNNKKYIIENLGDISMAKPQTLLQFLLWGNQQYPAEHLLVILSGHGFGFVGFMGDQKNKDVYLMSITGFAKVLSHFKRKTHKKIDILLFDTCCMNLVEVLYEIAIVSRNAARCALLACDNPPMEGLSWLMIIKVLNTDRQIKISEVACRIVESFNRMYTGTRGIFSVTLAKLYYKKLKALTNRLSKIILEKDNTTIGLGNAPNCSDNIFVSFLALLNFFNTRFNKAQKLTATIKNILGRIIIESKLTYNAKNLNSLYVYLPDTKEIYDKYKIYHKSLLFYKNNKWEEILYKLL